MANPYGGGYDQGHQLGDLGGGNVSSALVVNDLYP